MTSPPQDRIAAASSLKAFGTETDAKHVFVGFLSSVPSDVFHMCLDNVWSLVMAAHLVNISALNKTTVERLGFEEREFAKRLVGQQAKRLLETLLRKCPGDKREIRSEANPEDGCLLTGAETYRRHFVSALADGAPAPVFAIETSPLHLARDLMAARKGQQDDLRDMANRLAKNMAIAGDGESIVTALSAIPARNEGAEKQALRRVTAACEWGRLIVVHKTAYGTRPRMPHVR